MCEFNEKLFPVMLNGPHCSVWKTFASFRESIRQALLVTTGGGGSGGDGGGGGGSVLKSAFIYGLHRR